MPSSTRIRYPTRPCSAGGAPVTSEVNADAVVDGTTVVSVRVGSEDNVGIDRRPTSSMAEPSPSMTRTTTVLASCTSGGSHLASEPARSVGTSRDRQAPW